MDSKLSETELTKHLKDAASVVKVGAQYRHYKGNMYQVVTLAFIESTTEPAVVYRALYGERLQFIRPISDWLAAVTWQGKVVPRFLPVA